MAATSDDQCGGVRTPTPYPSSDQCGGVRTPLPYPFLALRRTTWLYVILGLLTLLVYLPAHRNEFVNYDDPDYVSGNLQVQAGLSWRGIVWAFTSGEASNWHPLSWLSHMLDWQLFGDNPAGHHVTSVLLHAANTLLLFMVLKLLTRREWPAFFVALFFAIHPLHVESVAWVSERKDVLSTMFFLLSIWAYGRKMGNGARGRCEVRSSKQEARVGRERPKGPGAKGGGDDVSRIRSAVLGFPWLSLAFFALGLMSKPMLVTLPFVLLLLDYWPLRRVEPFPRSKVSAPGTASLVALTMEKTPFFLLAIASCVVTYVVQSKGGAVSIALPLGDRLANAAVSYARYLGKFVWPQNLSVLYPHPGQWPVLVVVGAVLLLLVLSVLVWVFGRQRPYLIVGWLWFLGTLVPVIGIVQVGIQSMADRYSYIPLIGILIAVTWAIGDWVQTQPAARPLVIWLAAAAAFTCSVLSVRQIGFWRTSETLFTRAATVTDRNYLAYNNLGFYYSHKGRIEEAKTNYRKSLVINPAYEDALNNMGYALAGEGKPKEAVAYYEAALRVRPNHVEVHNNLGNALSELGKIDEAIAHYRFVLERNPEHADAHNNLGIALAMQGHLDEAIEHFRASLRVKPNNAGAHSNLGNALAAQRKWPEAVREYQESLRLKPEDPQARNNLANALVEQGKVQEALPLYREALRLQPRNPEALYNLGLVLLRLGNREEAIANFTEALRLKPDYAQAAAQLRGLR